VARDLVLVAPIAGVVMGRHAEPGEVLAPGTPVVTLGEIARPYVTVYLPEGALARVRVGAAAVGRLDGLPGRAFPGRVTAVSSAAEFTPRVALTEEERADLLFGVRVDFDDRSETLKPGLPVQVRFRDAVEAPVAAGPRRP
jgi:HlyD family secretion protein